MSRPIVIAGSRHHSRCNSARQSFSSNSSASSRLQSPRTLCPRDSDAFSYDPEHLKEWYMSSELWDALPPNLSKELAAFQHAGAAVLTGFERLAEMGHSLPEVAEEQSDPTPDQTTAHDAVAAKLYDHQRKSSRDELRMKEEEDYHCAPYRRDSGANGGYPFVKPTRSASFMGTSAISSGSITRSNSTSHPSPNSMEILTPETTVSPLDLPPLESLDSRNLPSPSVEGGIGGIASPRLATSKFVHHHDQRTAQYMAELHHLRHDILVRLRHSVIRVDAEYRDCRRSSTSGWGDGGFEDKPVTLPSDLDHDFEEWWKGKKEAAAELEHRASMRQLGRGVRASIGWGAEGGLGWEA